VKVIVAEDGRFRFVDQVANQVSGIVSVGNGNISVWLGPF